MACHTYSTHKSSHSTLFVLPTQLLGHLTAHGPFTRLACGNKSSAFITTSGKLCYCGTLHCHLLRCSSLTSPMRGRGYSSHSVCVCVCVCVCYRSSGRYAYSTGPTKVPKESAHHKDQNKRWTKNFKRSQLPTRMCYAAETTAIQFLFSSTLKWFTFLTTFFGQQKKTLDYSLRFL